MLGMILQKCYERVNSFAMWRFILRFVVPDVSKDCIVFIFKEKSHFKLKIKTVTSCKHQPLHSLQYTTSRFRRLFYFCSSNSSFFSCHFLSFINTFYYLSTFSTFVVFYSLSFSFTPSLLDSHLPFWLKRKSSIFAIASVLLAVEEASSDSLPLDKTIYFAEYQTPFQLGYNDQNINLVVPSSDYLQLSYTSTPSYAFVALYLVNYKWFLT
jgi:hypothetical protein